MFSVATSEYAEQVYNQAVEIQNPNPHPVPVNPTLTAPRRKYKKWSKEITALVAIMITAIILVFLSLLTQVTISNQNRQLQDLQDRSLVVSMENDNLSQEVQELSQYSRIMEIAETMGLEMNEANVRNVMR